MVIETTTTTTGHKLAHPNSTTPRAAPPPPPPPPPPLVDKQANTTATECDTKLNVSKSDNKQTTTKISKSAARHYYIDELGFYRHLDEDQKHYVCSNVNIINTATNTKTSQAINGNLPYQQKEQQQTTTVIGRNRISSGEAGLEVCFKTVRRDLGISHFDKTEDYENWKRGWDEFLRVKLVSQQPVTLNRDLKNRVRSGIPHDYRCKVWSALIRMRTRALRATFGEDIYEVIISDFVSKIGIPDYLTDQQQDSNNNNNMAKSANTNARNKQDKTKSSRVRQQDKLNGTSNRRATGSSYLGSTSIGSTSDFSSERGNQPAEHLSQRMIVQEPQIDQCFKQIELDLLRTLPNNRHFEHPNSIGIQRVRRVLRAYSCFNQKVGYCQGMNRLAAMALLVLPEEEAFWCLVAIIQCIMPQDYYLKPWLAQVDCCVLSDLLEKKLPKLHRHLQVNDIQLTLFSWFFTIFVDGFRPELLLRIWDIFLVEGDKILFRFALAILYITQDELLNMREFSEMSAHLNRLVSTRKLDIEQLFDSKYGF